MSDHEETPDSIDVIAERFVQEHRAGQHPTVSEYLSRYPESANQLRELLPTVAMMEELGLQAGWRDEGAKGLPTWDTPPVQQLGDYFLVREIGRGGDGSCLPGDPGVSGPACCRQDPGR